MNNNIKEILQSLKEHTWLEYEEMDKLSDYITNLQEENEKLNLYIEFYKSIIDKYKEVLDKIKEYIKRKNLETREVTNGNIKYILEILEEIE